MRTETGETTIVEQVSPSLLVVREAAQQLHVTLSRVQNMIADGRLAARKATKEEEALLLRDGRIHGVTTQGILVVQETDVALLATRSRKGGRPRKQKM